MQFAKSLSNMKPIKMNKSISAPQSARAVQLHGFPAVATYTGYGACICLRVMHNNCEVTLSLLCSKSCINPLTKPLTVQRLELIAALLLSQLMKRMHETLKIKIAIDDVYLFTDSFIVLGWLKTQILNLRAYVANRVKVIK